MGRALAVFRSEGIDATPAPSTFGSNASFSLHSRWRPKTANWLIGERVIYERLGQLYYTLRGWTSG
jgi:uncharacterized SAM-binding protein YcdF (DUF218 family)